MSQKTEPGSTSSSPPKEETTTEDLHPINSNNNNGDNQNGVNDALQSSKLSSSSDNLNQEKQSGEPMSVLSSHDMEDALLLQELFISGNNRFDDELNLKKKKEETVKLPKKKRKIELKTLVDDEKEAYDSRQFKKIDENIYLGDSTVNSWKYLNDDDIIMCSCGPSKKRDNFGGDDHCGASCMNRMLCMECVIGHCNCGSKCTNNVFQKKSWKKVEVKRAGEKGFGVFAKEKITKGSFIIEYVGEVLDEKIYKERQEAYDGERHYYFLSVGTNQIIDASKKGNNARFINHSCDPNAVLQKWTIGHQSRIGVFALRDIEKEEEITFDYAMECYGVSFQKCYCGSKNCRGTITSKEVSFDSKEKSTHLDSEQAKKLREHKLASKFKQRTLYTLKILEDSSKIPREVIDLSRNEKAFLIRNIRRTEKKRFRQFLTIEKQLNETKQKEVPEFDELGLTEYERAQQIKMFELMAKGAGIVREREIKSRRCKTVSSSSSLAETATTTTAKQEKQPRVTRTAKKKVETKSAATNSEEPKKKRGRPPTKRNAEESDKSDEDEEESDDDDHESKKNKSRGKVGRPKKNSSEEEPKRKVGRPRKDEKAARKKDKPRTELASKSETKRKVGRPKKEEPKKPQTKKRKVADESDSSSSSSSDSDSDESSSRNEAKRKVGRPRKSETNSTTTMITTPKVEEEKRKVGRPKKLVEDKKQKKVETKATTSSSSSSSNNRTASSGSTIGNGSTIKTESKSVSSTNKQPILTTPKKSELKSTTNNTTTTKSTSSSSTSTTASTPTTRTAESEAPKRKVGRPRKDENETTLKEVSNKKEPSKTSSGSTSSSSTTTTTGIKSESSSSADSKPRRITHNSKSKEDSSESEEAEEAPKRKVGRPRKDEKQPAVKKEEENQPAKRKVGRPRKDEQAEPKRKVGRPRKTVVDSSESSSDESSESDHDENPKNDYEVFSKFNVRISKVKAYECLSSLPNKRKYNSQKPKTTQ